MLALLERLPSTNARIAVTLVCLVATAGRYLAYGAPGDGAGWETWLLFLGAMAGIDVAQFAVKRRTEIVAPPAVMASDAEAPSVAAAGTVIEGPVVSVAGPTSGRVAIPHRSARPMSGGLASYPILRGEGADDDPSDAATPPVARPAPYAGPALTRDD